MSVPLELLSLSATHAFFAGRTAVEMMIDRGYTVFDDPTVQARHASIQTFANWLATTSTAGDDDDGATQRGRQGCVGASANVITVDHGALGFTARRPEGSTARNAATLVRFASRAVSAVHLNEYLASAKEAGALKMVLIICGDAKVTPAAKKVISEFSRSADWPLHIQLLPEDELLYNVTRHQSVPKHVPLSDADSDADLAPYGLQRAQLPRMLLKDPIAQYFGLDRGQVIRIERINSESGAPYVTYRVVV